MLRLVEARRGRFLALDTDAYVGKSLIELGEYGEEQSLLFDKLLKPEAVVVEVGSNIGAHTVGLAKKARMVHAFEPQRRLFHILCGNVALNELDNVNCYRIAAGENRETVDITVLDFDCQDNNTGSFSLDSPGPRLDWVEVVPISIACDFLKIDVEGWEAKVLKGASSMIKSCKPVMYIENDRVKKSDELIGLVNGLGYKAYWHVTNLFNSKNKNGVTKDPFGFAVSIDMLCLPKDIKFDGMPEAKIGQRPAIHE